MSIFPFIESKPIAQDTSLLPLYKEVAWDFKNNAPIIENGTFKILEGKDALKTWIYKTLKTERYKYLIYSWNYGQEFDSLIGKSYSMAYSTAEGLRYVKEALMINEYIKNVRVLNSEFKEWNLFKLTVEVDTIYGKTEVKV